MVSQGYGKRPNSQWSFINGCFRPALAGRTGQSRPKMAPLKIRSLAENGSTDFSGMHPGPPHLSRTGTAMVLVPTL